MDFPVPYEFMNWTKKWDVHPLPIEMVTKLNNALFNYISHLIYVRPYTCIKILKLCLRQNGLMTLVLQ